MLKLKIFINKVDKNYFSKPLITPFKAIFTYEKYF